jgi:hypothetical protein
MSPTKYLHEGTAILIHNVAEAEITYFRDAVFLLRVFAEGHEYVFQLQINMNHSLRMDVR